MTLNAEEKGQFWGCRGALGLAPAGRQEGKVFLSSHDETKYT